MAQSCERSLRKYFDDRYHLNWPRLANSKSSERNVRTLKYLEVINMQELILPEHRSFRHLVYECLEINPYRRIRPSDALRHEFFR
jgi:hypothetical protein